MYVDGVRETLLDYYCKLLIIIWTGLQVALVLLDLKYLLYDSDLVLIEKSNVFESKNLNAGCSAEGNTRFRLSSRSTCRRSTIKEMLVTGFGEVKLMTMFCMAEEVQ